MPNVRCSGLEFAYRDGVPLLSALTVHLRAGWYGLVAENGAGKTTFLRLLRGELAPDRGVVVCAGRVALCEQEVEEAGPSVHALAARTDHEACVLRGQLALGELCHWDRLSPGERKRWQVAAALAEAPEVLLLDEPSNHLDAEARGQLLAALAGYRGVGVVVSHDRALLDALTTETLRLAGGQMTVTPGGYSAAQALWEAEARHRQEVRRLAQDQVRRLERQLDQARRNQEGAARDLSAGRRMRNRHDSDARGVGAHLRVEWAEARLGRGVGAAQAQLARAREAVGEGQRTLGGAVFARYEPARRPVLLSLDRKVFEAGPLRGEVTVALRRGERVWVSGGNGAGKSTLVEALVAGSSLPEEKLLWLPQELTARESVTLLAEVRAAPAEVKGRVLSLVAALGSDPARILASARLSPGEARKLAIALGLGRHVWALVLDEPTNHLDLPSVERLERTLADFPGALLLVTHDAEMAGKCTTGRWEVGGGRVEVG